MELQRIEAQVELANLPAHLQAQLAGVLGIAVRPFQRRQPRGGIKHQTLGTGTDDIGHRKVTARRRNAIMHVTELIIGTDRQGVAELPLRR
ncbi:hypothetical protein D3C86_1770060 [compost metagenome]